MEAGTPKGIASQLDLDLDDLSICLACLSFVSMAIDGGDERDIRGQVTRITPDLWAKGWRCRRVLLSNGRARWASLAPRGRWPTSSTAADAA
jgi:hypothetical protein